MTWCSGFLPGESFDHLADSHCHLDFPEFDDDRDTILDRARAAGVRRFLVPGVRADQWRRLRELAGHYDDWSYALGLHPYFIDAHVEADLVRLEQELAADKQPLALGEIGLDATVGDHDWQQVVFKKQVDLAAAHGLPVILHHRKTLDVMLKIVKAANVRAGVIHAFSGSYEQAMAWIDQGFYLGVGGVITYERARKTRDAIRRVPAEALLLETDSPDMPVQGYQGQRNEPARLVMIRDALREIRR